jgi:hypothetical protein
VSELLDRIVEAGLTPAEYLAEFERQAAHEPGPDADPETREHWEFTGLNLHRTRRIARTWQPSPELAAACGRLPGPQTWLVLTEPWCGDSAQCLPCLATLAASREDVTLRMVLRDAHPDLMDRYLTDGKRSIPILAGLDPAGRELFRWGPRPAAAQAVVDAARAAGLAKPELQERLHLFYGRDRGRALDAELTALFAGVAG